MRALFLWRQEDTSSLRLFSVDSSGRQMIRNFSLRQRLHLLLELLYGECDERMRQEIKCSMLLSLRVQICLLSSVEFLCLALRNDVVWFLYLVLKSFSVSPMYVSVVLLSLRVTVACRLLMIAGSFRRAGMYSFVAVACLVVNNGSGGGGGGVINLYRCG